jgi:hypothetical protein
VAADEVLACNGFSERCMDAYQNQTTGTVNYAYSRALLLHTQSRGTCQQGSGKVGQFIILLQFAQLHAVISGCSFVLCPSFHFFALCLRVTFCRFRICVEEILLHDPSAPAFLVAWRFPLGRYTNNNIYSNFSSEFVVHNASRIPSALETIPFVTTLSSP